MKHIAIKQTGGIKGAFAAGIGTAMKHAQSSGCAEVLLVVARDADLGPGIIEDVLGRKSVASLKKGLAIKVNQDLPSIRATTIRKVRSSSQSKVVVAAYLDPKTTDQVLEKLGAVSVCVHVLWMPEHVDELVDSKDAELVSIPEK